MRTPLAAKHTIDALALLECLLADTWKQTRRQNRRMCEAGLVHGKYGWEATEAGADLGQ